jgi:hypothetical protein
MAICRRRKVAIAGGGVGVGHLQGQPWSGWSKDGEKTKKYTFSSRETGGETLDVANGLSCIFVCSLSQASGRLLQFPFNRPKLGLGNRSCCPTISAY